MSARPQIASRAPFVGEPSMTIAEFCAHEGISRSTYYNLRKKGRAPAETRYDGRLIRITPSSHAEFRRKNTVRPAKAS
jgi:predicted DNA-binding transcriptional regulator AlpA